MRSVTCWACQASLSTGTLSCAAHFHLSHPYCKTLWRKDGRACLQLWWPAHMHTVVLQEILMKWPLCKPKQPRKANGYLLNFTGSCQDCPSIYCELDKKGRKRSQGIRSLQCGKIGCHSLGIFPGPKYILTSWLGSLSGPVMCATLSRIFRTEFTFEKLNGVYVFVVSLCELTLAELQSTEFYARN